MIEPCKNSGTQEFSMSTSFNNLNVLSELSGAQCRITKCDMRRFPVDTGRKLNVHKTFRRRPGRLLNVLCMFNLRPVSTGVVSTLRRLELHFLNFEIVLLPAVTCD